MVQDDKGMEGYETRDDVENQSRGVGGAEQKADCISGKAAKIEGGREGWGFRHLNLSSSLAV